MIEYHGFKKRHLDHQTHWATAAYLKRKWRMLDWSAVLLAVALTLLGLITLELCVWLAK